MGELNRRDLQSGETVVCSQVQKQSEKGLFMNRRLLLMAKNKFICYLSSPETALPRSLQLLEREAKTVVPLNTIHRLHYQEDNRLQIDFWVDGPQKKPIINTWRLKMKTPTLLGAWQDVFDQYSNRSRAGTLITEDSKTAPNFEGNVHESLAKLAGQPSAQLYPPAQIAPLAQHSIPPALQSLTATLNHEVSHSNHLLRQDLSESYFATLHGASLSPPHRNPKELSLQTDKFVNCFRPHLDTLLQIESSILRGNELKDANKRYRQFVTSAEEAVVELVDWKLQEVVRETTLGQNRKKKQGLICEERDGMVLELCLLQLKQVGGNAYICDRSMTDRLTAHFINMQFLQDVIGKDRLLRQTFFMPMACLVTYRGFLSLVSSKIEPSAMGDYHISSHNTPPGQLFDLLSEKTRTDFSVFEDSSKIEFLPLNSFQNKFAIAHARCFLPELEPGMPVSPDIFYAVYPEGSVRTVGTGRRETQDHRRTLQFVGIKIGELADLMNKLEVYPLTHAQMEPLLHNFGLDVKCIGKLFEEVTHPYLQSLLKTETAVQAFWLVFAKKMQDTLGRRGIQGLEEAALQLLNAFLGLGEDCSQLWKVVSLHSQKYFGLSVGPQQVNKGYLLLGLSSKLGVDIHPSTSSIDSIFKIKAFVEGVLFHVTSICPWLLPSFMNSLRYSDLPSQGQLFGQIVSTFQLEDRSLPELIAKHPHVQGQVLLLMAFYSSPKDSKYRHMGIYAKAEEVRKMTGSELQRGLAEIRWEIKQSSPKEHVLKLIERLRGRVKSLFGEIHPFLSQIYELQGLYHVSLGDEAEAVEANKQALRNMVACCGHNQNHLRLSNTHYNIADCLAQYGRLQQALSHLRKAKLILQTNHYQNQPSFAHLLLRMAGLVLHQQQDSQALQYLQQAVSINQKDPCRHWPALVDSYEMMTRCQVRPNSFQGLRLAEQAALQLQVVLETEQRTKTELCSHPQLIRVIKVILEQYLLKITKEDKGLFRNYLLQVCDSLTQALELDNRREACMFFRLKIIQGSLLRDLQTWTSGAGQMASRWRQEGGARGLRPRSEAVVAFDQFMRQTVALVGQSFLLNTL